MQWTLTEGSRFRLIGQRFEGPRPKRRKDFQSCTIGLNEPSASSMCHPDKEEALL